MLSAMSLGIKHQNDAYYSRVSSVLVNTIKHVMSLHNSSQEFDMDMRKLMFNLWPNMNACFHKSYKLHKCRSFSCITRNILIAMRKKCKTKT